MWTKLISKRFVSDLVLKALYMQLSTKYYIKMPSSQQGYNMQKVKDNIAL
jgi:hypothetical protein